MISYLEITPLTQSRLVSLRLLRKQSQTCQAQSGSCISPTADHLLPPTHRLYRAAWVSRLRALTLVVTLGVIFLFANSAAWANGCSGDTVISTNVTSTQANSTQLCSFTVNNGNSISTSGEVAIRNSGTITKLDNNGSILSDDSGIYNPGTIETLNNTGTISGTSFSIYNPGTITTLNNTGTISGGSFGIYNPGTITTLINNSGTISAFSYGIYNVSSLETTTLSNSGSISGYYGIFNYAPITTLNNSGSISGSSEGIFNVGPMMTTSMGTIETLNNTGTISGTDNGINNQGTIETLNNTGTISGTNYYGIDNNYGAIDTFNNLQGMAASTSTPVTFNGNLPTSYNIIVSNPSTYGQVVFSNIPVGSTTTFGISSLSGGASVVSATPYGAVMAGIASSQFGSKLSGTSNGYTYSLTETAASSSIWDLLISAFYSGPSTVSTQQSLVNTASALQPIYTLQNSVLANSFSYDCSLFGPNGVCISAGGRNTAVQAANGLNNTSALLIASYRLDKNNSRIGAYADQNLSVNNAGSTVTLGNNTPLVGLFGVWSQRPDGIGSEVKVSAAYGQKDTTITRQVVGLSEAGSGSSQLNSQGAQVVAKYGFGIAENTVISPYVGMRYTQNNMGGYTENTSATVTAPLTYSALNTNATTALAGVGARHLLTPKTMVMASVGVESDTNTANGSYSGTSSSISGLTPVNFNANPVRTRPTASVGAYYNVEKNQRIGLSGIYRQEPYQAVSTTSVFLTYTIGL